MGMTGNLSERLFPEILMHFSLNSKSGTLVVRRNPTEKKIYFDKGSVVFAEGNVPQDHFGELLINIGKLSPSQLEGASEKVSAEKPLGKVLVEMGLFAATEIRELLELQVQEIIYPLFDWNNGEFEFKNSSTSLDKDLGLSISTHNLVLEGIRRIKNSEIIHKGLKGTESLVRLAPDYESKVADLLIKPDEAFILSRIEPTSRISEILQVSPLGLEMTQKALYGFISTGIIEFVTDSNESASTSPPRSYRAQRSQELSATPPSSETSEKEEEDIKEARADILLMLEDTKKSNYYDLLKVPSNACFDEIKKAYYGLAKKYHPDHYQASAIDLKNSLDTIFSTLSQAYDTLKVPATRASYDAKIFKLEENQAHSTEKSVTSQTSATGGAQQKLAELNYRQGRGYFDQKDYWSASQAFRQSVRLEPENARYRHWLATCLTKNPKWRREAEEHFLKAIELEQFNPSHYLGLGLLYQEVGMPKRAEAQFRQALQLSPGDRAAKEALETLASSKGSEKKGFKTLKTLFGKK
ncbi:MAG: hypothetical protein DMG05_11410 [Acidobacteria bacterium]|nr:MAG: hypothetical protein DMG05_11410 [Acidobacteriota bacterium]